VKREPELVSTAGPKPERLGISGGLTNLCALAISKDFSSLYEAVLEVARLFVRLCRFTSVRSRAMEDRPGIWGWAVLGITPDELSKVLDQFQRGMVSENIDEVLPYELIDDIGDSPHQKSKGRCDRRSMEHRYWTTECPRACHPPMPGIAKSSKERVEHSRPPAHCHCVPDGPRLHCWEFGLA
jgi:hypothetical protein